MQSLNRRPAAALTILAVLVLGPWPTRAAFIADLSHHLIAITTAFTGSNVLLFGTTEPGADDVVTVVRGPAQEVTVRRKDRFGVFWLNHDEVTFATVPAYYAVAASGPLDQIGLPRELQRQQIGFENLPFNAEDPGPGIGVPAFRDALIRNKQGQDLYAPVIGNVRFLGESLFRTTLSFPANIPPGSYKVEIYQFKDGRVAAAQQSALTITKIGAEAEVYDLSRHNPVLYALASVGLALVAGYSAGLIFRK